MNAKLLPQPKYLLTFLPEAHDSPDGMQAFDDILIEWRPEGWLLSSDQNEVLVPHEGVGLLVEALRSREDAAFEEAFFDEWDKPGSEIRTGLVADPAPADPDPDPNAIAPGHNPNKLTNAQVGISDGWRLLADDELADTVRTYRGTDWWDTADTKWCSGVPWAAYREGSSTLRTKNPPGFYRIEGGAK